jgi:nucleotide-binding universal stress UspA family protein
MTHRTHPVLVGVDGTASGLEALALGMALATLNGSPLVLGAVYGFDGGMVASGLEWPRRDNAEHWLAQAEERLGDAIAWSVRSVVSTSVAHGLVALATEESVDMIVLGSSRHGPLGRVLAGSTVRRVAHGAPCAVAVTPRDWRVRSSPTALTIGAGVTDSTESREALALAARLGATAHARLRVLTAIHLMSPANPVFAATGTSYADWRDGERAFAQRLARAAVEDVTTEAPAEIVVLEGDPVEQLAEASGALDFLVLGSRRYGPLRSALLGGVSSGLIARAECPVIIAPRGAYAEPRSAASVAAIARA